MIILELHYFLGKYLVISKCTFILSKKIRTSAPTRTPGTLFSPIAYYIVFKQLKDQNHFACIFWKLIESRHKEWSPQILSLRGKMVFYGHTKSNRCYQRSRVASAPVESLGTQYND